MASGGASCARVCVCPRPHSAPPAAQEEVQENTTKIQVLSVGPLLAEVRGPRRPAPLAGSPRAPQTIRRLHTGESVSMMKESLQRGEMVAKL